MPETRPNPGQGQQHHRWQDTHPAIDDRPPGMPERTIGLPPTKSDAPRHRQSPPTGEPDRLNGTSLAALSSRCPKQTLFAFD
ncbi:MAG TPA: hypothetical protein DD982_04890 [Thalassospira sp.]|nr:hypothetical protein BC440_11240 [Thalassospira sp. MIT1004]HBS21849.1 hypothetical protein [Thalassospira sp.]